MRAALAIVAFADRCDQMSLSIIEAAVIYGHEALLLSVCNFIGIESQWDRAVSELCTKLDASRTHVVNVTRLALGRSQPRDHRGNVQPHVHVGKRSGTSPMYLSSVCLFHTGPSRQKTWTSRAEPMLVVRISR